MAAAQDIIKNFMHSLDYTDLPGEYALDEAVRSVSRFSEGLSERTHSAVGF